MTMRFKRTGLQGRHVVLLAGKDAHWRWLLPRYRHAASLRILLDRPVKKRDLRWLKNHAARLPAQLSIHCLLDHITIVDTPEETRFLQDITDIVTGVIATHTPRAAEAVRRILGALALTLEDALAVRLRRTRALVKLLEAQPYDRLEGCAGRGSFITQALRWQSTLRPDIPTRLWPGRISSLLRRHTNNTQGDASSWRRYDAFLVRQAKPGNPHGAGSLMVTNLGPDTRCRFSAFELAAAWLRREPDVQIWSQWMNFSAWLKLCLHLHRVTGRWPTVHRIPSRAPLGNMLMPGGRAGASCAQSLEPEVAARLAAHGLPGAHILLMSVLHDIFICRIPCLLTLAADFDTWAAQARRYTPLPLLLRLTLPSGAAETHLAALAARNHGIPSLDVQALLASNTLRHAHLPADYAAVIDEWEKSRYIKQFGWNPSRVHVVGCLHLSPILRDMGHWRRDVLRAQYGARTDGITVLFALQPADPEICLHWAGILVQWAAAAPGRTLWIKPHPAEGAERVVAYHQLLKDTGLGERGKVLSAGTSIYPFIFACDAVATFFSNAGLEAAMMGRKVLALSGVDEDWVELAARGVAQYIEDKAALSLALAELSALAPHPPESGASPVDNVMQLIDAIRTI